MNLAQRVWTYQSERFPLATHGLVVFVLAAGAVGFSLLARNQSWTTASLAPLLVAFLVSLGLFFQLRVADEYKDFADDAQFRPYRPVPRGLITLRELAALALAVAIIQLLLTLWLRPSLLWFLIAIWAYGALMRWEFFAHDWLRRRPILYLLSHMVITPLIVLYCTACDWHVAGAQWPRAIGWFLAAAFANGVVFEIGRKLRAPADEETGVETYSFLWGPKVASQAWAAALAAAGVAAMAALRIVVPQPAATWLSIAILLFGIVAIGVARVYASEPTSVRAKRVELSAGLWMLVFYLTFALAPFFAS